RSRTAGNAAVRLAAHQVLPQRETRRATGQTGERVPATRGARWPYPGIARPLLRRGDVSPDCVSVLFLHHRRTCGGTEKHRASDRVTRTRILKVVPTLMCGGTENQ